MSPRETILSIKVADMPAVKAAILAAYEHGWTDGYGQGRDDEADAQPIRTRADVVTEPVHGCPPDDSGLTPCCGRTPFELPYRHRMTTIPALVTCSPSPDTDNEREAGA